MIAVIQRIKSATVYADGVLFGAVGEGLYILLGVLSGDAELDAELLCDKIAKLRIFSDGDGKMNLSALDIGAQACVVSNFTLAANYKKGNRPDYLNAEAPERANGLYEYFVKKLGEQLSFVATGKFGADMRTELVTDGPVTIVMDSKVLSKKGKV